MNIVNSAPFERLHVPEALGRLLKRCPKAELYAVGGSVRDLLIGREPRDIDFVVRRVPYERLAKFLRAFGRVELAGRRFGVIKFRPKASEVMYDISLPRLEHSLGLTGAYRAFKVQTDPELKIEEDLGRRDFTINALAWNVKRERLVDPFGGLNDLAVEKIRTVGEPALRFREDFTRLLRALRFSVQLGFEVEPKTWRTLRHLIGHLNEAVLPREVLGIELVRMFQAGPLQAIDLLDLSGALRVLMPEVLAMKGCQQTAEFHSEGDVWQHSRLAVEALGSPEFKAALPEVEPDAELALAAWLHDVGKPVTRQEGPPGHRRKLRFLHHDEVGAALAAALADRLKLSSADGIVKPERLRWLIRYHLLVLSASTIGPAALERYFLDPILPGDKLLALSFADGWASIRPGGARSLEGFYLLQKKINEVKKIGFTGRELKRLVDGQDIIRELGLPPGPAVGRILAAVREAQLKAQLKTRAQALAFIRQRFGKSKLNRKS